ncbi:acyltransferase family protein [soil metagenome]
MAEADLAAPAAAEASPRRRVRRKVGPREPAKRIFWADAGRGYSVVLVVFGHIYNALYQDVTTTGLIVYLLAMLSVFRMPFFFMIAGVTDNATKGDNSFDKFLRIITRTIIVPYLCFALIGYAVWGTRLYFREITGANWWQPIPDTLYGITNGGGEALAHNFPIWFLTCLASLKLLAFLMRHGGQARRWLMSLSFIIAAVVLIDARIRLPWNLEIAALMLPFFLTGVLVRDEVLQGRWRKIEWPVVIGGFVVWAALSRINGAVNISDAAFGKLWMFLPASAGALIFSLGVLPRLPRIKAIEACGRASISILGLHYLFIMDLYDPSLRLIAWFTRFMREDLAFTLVTLIVATFASTVCVFAHKGFERWLPFVVGKRNDATPPPAQEAPT